MAIIHEQQGEVIAFSYVCIRIIGVLFFSAKKGTLHVKEPSGKNYKYIKSSYLLTCA